MAPLASAPGLQLAVPSRLPASCSAARPPHPEQCAYRPSGFQITREPPPAHRPGASETPDRNARSLSADSHTLWRDSHTPVRLISRWKRLGAVSSRGPCNASKLIQGRAPPSQGDTSLTLSRAGLQNLEVGNVRWLRERTRNDGRIRTAAARTTWQSQVRYRLVVHPSGGLADGGLSS